MRFADVSALSVGFLLRVFLEHGTRPQQRISQLRCAKRFLLAPSRKYDTEKLA